MKEAVNPSTSSSSLTEPAAPNVGSGGLWPFASISTDTAAMKLPRNRSSAAILGSGGGSASGQNSLFAKDWAVFTPPVPPTASPPPAHPMGMVFVHTLFLSLS